MKQRCCVEGKIMKKRRPCTWNSSRLAKSSPRPFHVREFDNFPTETKSFHELKHLQKYNSKSQKKNAKLNESSLKRDAFGSLESLFDLKKPLNLPEIHSFTIEYHQEGHVPLYKSKSLKNSKHIVESVLLQQTAELEPHILERTHEADDHKRKEEEEDKQKPNLETLESEERKSENSETKESLNMAENESQEFPDNKSDRISLSKKSSSRVGSRHSGLGSKHTEVGSRHTEVGDKGLEATIKEISNTGTVGQWDQVPPYYPLPPGVGEGASIKPGGRQESMLSSSPFTDSTVKLEMKNADERCAVLAKDIEQLKLEIAELSKKKDLTSEDTLTIQKKQDEVMRKLAEFEQITRKLQRLLGLADVSSTAFAKMFDMIPQPYSKLSLAIAEEEEDVAAQEKIRDKIDKEVSATRISKPEDRFDLPQIEYPEDKLPRVIVCGNTEDEIPKIVVADSKKKGKESLQTLTGKLTESLTMQEKLAKENAQLEGGKYKLEEALLEKDSAVESLQRKVCGLQAEMRIVVKENVELTRQIACLNQRVTSPCCYTCPGAISSGVSSPCPLRSVSYTTTLQQDDDYCRCKCCLQPDSLSPIANAAGVKAGSRTCVPSEDSPRLAGGASVTGACITSGASSQIDEMCCRSPAVAKSPCAPPPPKSVCPAEIENKIAAYESSNKQLEQQLGSMECEVRNMQMELANVQRERQQLEQQRKLLKCTAPCAPCGCCPPSPMTLQGSSPPPYVPPPTLPPVLPPSSSVPLSKMPPPPTSTCTGSCINAPMGASTCPQQQLRDLREQYARLQDDYKNKLCEVSCLRTDAEKLKQQTRETIEEKEKLDIKLIDAQERLKALEAEKDKYEGFKEQMIEQEQALIVFKQRFREAQDELEELRSMIQDQAAQLEDYRNKYLQAQQQVEEQRRQLDLMEMDNARMNENVTLEIGRVKNQFQEKLAELAPLPDILKQTQVKLQEAQQMRAVAERNCEDLSRELLTTKDKMQALQNQLDVMHNEFQQLQDERGHGSGRFDELERKNAELRHENERMKNTLARFEEHEAQLQKRIDEKMHEVTQLTAMLDQVREDSARQVARTKERCETARRTMQSQIAEMERQLAQCRATARAAQKDRDEIRQKMQGQINNLNEAFEQAQGRIRSLQGHVNYLKTSYSNIFKGQGEMPPGVLPGEAGTGFDSCDCNY